jgi:hypothetical protein
MQPRLLPDRLLTTPHCSWVDQNDRIWRRSFW